MADAAPDGYIPPMIHGSCLCGGVRFEFDSAVGPFELCHCTRCRKASGSQFMAGIAIRADGFRITAGRELITKFELPVDREPPAYSRIFCSRCGCVVPDPEPTTEVFEIAAGLLDDDPGLRPDRHIMVEHKAPWTDFRAGDLPRFDLPALLELRGHSSA